MRIDTAPVTIGPGRAVNDKDVIANMQARAEQCRRLSDMITDKDARDSLRAMAAEIERDIAKLCGEAELPLDG
jgi:hypothetical protein